MLARNIEDYCQLPQFTDKLLVLSIDNILAVTAQIYDPYCALSDDYVRNERVDTSHNDLKQCDGAQSKEESEDYDDIGALVDRYKT